MKYEVGELFKSQLSEWNFANKQYAALQKVETKTLKFKGGATVKVQFNPERIKSSAAKVDKKSIAERPCFLCAKNRPAEQKGIDFENFKILINPFPIFPVHLTIVHTEHTEQLIKPFVEPMLKLSKKLQGFTLFYNGAKCGASAPDHFHFQAGIEGFLPIEEDFRTKKFAVLVIENPNIKVYKWTNYEREIITIESNSYGSSIDMINKIYGILAKMYNHTPEPMLNILSYYKSGNYVIHIFPRSVHRPDCYFAEGSEQILLSPASVDMGGVLITPRKEDYDKITAKDISDIFAQVCITAKETDEIISKLKI